MKTARSIRENKNATMNKKNSILQSLFTAERQNRSYGQLLKVVYCDADTYPLMRVLY